MVLTEETCFGSWPSPERSGINTLFWKSGITATVFQTKCWKASVHGSGILKKERFPLKNPEGISACNLLLHWKELCEIYAKESWFDDPAIREEKLESLCAEDKKVFYATVSRIKKKFVAAVGPCRADAYIIRKNGDGVYCLNATLLK